ncbi:MAG: biotin--[acetyl-CoA-carboxylase] ligase [Gemmataceae bacterium]|nr:biotin--[acetyl-CoA-carboxylase] ligase [Gemmataceae bacterium]
MQPTLPTIVPLEHVVWTLPTQTLGRTVLAFSQLESTNTLALALADDPRRHGLVVLADLQTAGRGQYGRTWQAPAGSSVLISVVLFPPRELCRPAVMTVWAAVTVAEVIADLCGLDPCLKWPNDVYVLGKKVCGVLCEQRSGPSAAVVVGIGLNVNQPADFFETAGLTLGGSLFSLSGTKRSPHDVARQLILRLDEAYGRLEAGDRKTLEKRWTDRMDLIGRLVRIETATRIWTGRLVGMSFDAIQLEADSHAPLRLAPEAVLHMTAVEPEATGSPTE